MSVSLFDKKWIDLVFDGKNQSYGAYQLRLEHTRTQCLAFIYGLGLLVGFILLGIVTATPTQGKTVVTSDPPLIVYRIPIIKEEATAASGPKKSSSTPKIQSNPHPRFVPVEQIQVTPELKPSESVTEAGRTSNQAGTAVTDGLTGSPEGGGDVLLHSATVDEPDDAIVDAAMVDEMPEFPGGMKRFYDSILKHIEHPEIDQDVRLFVTFIIEPDGQMSHIQVLRNPGYGLQEETLRVMEKIRTPWKPGMRKGKKVRTQFTLPFTFKSID